MGAQRLSARSVRRLSRQTGLFIDGAWAHGGTHWLSVLLPGHVHAELHRHSGRVRQRNGGHYVSCGKVA